MSGSQQNIIDTKNVDKMIRNSRERRQSRNLIENKSIVTHKAKRGRKPGSTIKKKEKNNGTNCSEENSECNEIDVEVVKNLDDEFINQYKQNDNYMLEIVTTQCNIIKQIIDTLNGPLNDINLIFSKKGINLCQASEQKIIINLELSAEKFEIYNYKFENEKTIVGINIRMLYDFIRTISSNTIMTMFIDKNELNKFGIIFSNNSHKIISKHKINMCDCNVTDYNLINYNDYSVCVNINSTLFYKICRDVAIISSQIEIKRANPSINQIIFSYDNANTKNEKTISESEFMKFIKNENNKNDEIIQAYYDIKSIMKFVKLSNMSKNMSIYLSNDFPIMLEYNTGSLGTIQIWIKPENKIKD